MSKKENVSTLDFSRAFQALEDINDEETYTGKTEYVVKKRNLYENFQKPESILDNLMEDFYSLSEEDDVEQAAQDTQEEIAQAKLDKIEKIVDLDAKTVDDLQPSYVGKFIIQCPQCLTLFYKNSEDIVHDENGGEFVNINEPCQHCGNDTGYTLIGKVDEATEDEFNEEQPAEETPEDVEEPTEEETTPEEENASKEDSEGSEDDGIDDLNAIMDEVDNEEANESLNLAKAAPSENETENNSENATSLNESAEQLTEGPIKWLKGLAQNKEDKKTLKLINTVQGFDENKVVSGINSLLKAKNTKFKVTILDFNNDEVYNVKDNFLPFVLQHAKDENFTKDLNDFIAAVTYAKSNTKDIKSKLALIYTADKADGQKLLATDLITPVTNGVISPENRKRLDNLYVNLYIDSKNTTGNTETNVENNSEEQAEDKGRDASTYLQYLNNTSYPESLNVSEKAPSDNETKNNSEEATSLNEGATDTLKKIGKVAAGVLGGAGIGATAGAGMTAATTGNGVPGAIVGAIAGGIGGGKAALENESVNNPEAASENETENDPEHKTLNEDDELVSDISDADFNKTIDSLEDLPEISEEEAQQNIDELSTNPADEDAEAETTEDKPVEEGLTEDADTDSFEQKVDAALASFDKYFKNPEKEVKEDLEQETEDDDLELDEESFDECVLESLTDVYSDVTGYQTTKTSCTEDNKIIVEGLITLKNNKEKQTKFVFDKCKKDEQNPNSLKFRGFNESLNLKTIISVGKDMNKLYTTALKYKFDIKGNLVEGLSKRK